MGPRRNSHQIWGSGSDMKRHKRHGAKCGAEGKAFGQLVALGFGVAAFTPAPYQRPRLGRPSNKGALISRKASRLDAFSAYPHRTRVPSGGGAKPPRRCELLGGISLLSPEYLLSFERRSFHTHPPDHYAPVSCLLGMSPSQSSALMPLHSVRPVANRPEGTFGSLRYAFGGDHPSQTARQAVSGL